MMPCQLEVRPFDFKFTLKFLFVLSQEPGPCVLLVVRFGFAGFTSHSSKR